MKKIILSIIAITISFVAGLIISAVICNKCVNRACFSMYANQLIRDIRNINQLHNGNSTVVMNDLAFQIDDAINRLNSNENDETNAMAALRFALSYRNTNAWMTQSELDTPTNSTRGVKEK